MGQKQRRIRSQNRAAEPLAVLSSAVPLDLIYRVRAEAMISRESVSSIVRRIIEERYAGNEERA